MARHKVNVKAKRLVWRISVRAPLGEWVDPNLPVEPPQKDPSELSSDKWVRSSYDLLNGVEINDDPNTVPDELFDELFFLTEKKPKAPPE